MQKTVILLEDDIDGTKAAQTIEFALDGATYEIDLNTKNANRLRKELAPYIEKARVTSKAKKSVKKGKAVRSDLPDVRAWAKSQGFEIAERGRVPKEIQEAYDARHQERAA